MNNTDLSTFLANLAHAVRNRETITVGGGDFSPAELAAILVEIQRLRGEVGQ
jgi:hypothetical protein